MPVTVQDDHIYIAGESLWTCKSIPNGRKVGSNWVYPLSPTSAYLIKKKFACSGHPIFMEYSKGPALREEDLELKTKLWSHQKDAVSLTGIRSGCLLNMGMGTGKSLSAIASLNLCGARKTLILCPKAVVGVWPKQFELHSKRQYRVIRLDQTSTKKKIDTLKEALAIRSDKPLVVVINYPSCWRAGMDKLLKEIKFDALILDESHRIKTHTGKASRFCADIADLIPKRIALTGTPIPHSPVDLFAQFRAIDIDLFGRYITPFKDKYTIKGGFQGKEVVGFQNQEDMKEKFDLLSYTVTTKEALPDLPDTLDEDIILELEPKAKKLYKKLERDFIAFLEEEEKSVVVKNALGKLLRLQQMTSGYARTDDEQDIQIDTSKIDAVRDILTDHGNSKVVIFCRFKHDLKLCRELCQNMGLAFAELSGEHHELTDDATMPDDADVMIVQIQSGSVGVDLSKASIAINYSVSFSLGEYLQSRARLHRPGQKNKVIFYHLKCKGTVDFKIYKAFEKKQDIIRMIIDDGYGGEDDG